MPLPAQLADDGARLVWWHDDELFAVDKEGGAPVRVGSLVAAGRWFARLTVDGAGYHLGAARLRRGESTYEIWLPEDFPVVVDDGTAAWLEQDEDGTEYRLYRLPSDADGPGLPLRPAGTL